MPSTYSQSGSGFRCDDCGAEMAFPLFCGACGMDYPERRGMSAFALLGLPQEFAIKEEELDSKELEFARALHPDAHQSKGELVHRRAVLAQSAANAALSALRDPFSRGESLLALSAEARTQGLDRPGKLDKSFLIDQLTLQEELAEGISEERRRELLKKSRNESKSITKRMAEAFASGKLEDVRRALDESRYWRNVGRIAQGQAAV